MLPLSEYLLYCLFTKHTIEYSFVSITYIIKTKREAGCSLSQVSSFCVHTSSVKVTSHWLCNNLQMWHKKFLSHVNPFSITMNSHSCFRTDKYAPFHQWQDWFWWKSWQVQKNEVIGIIVQTHCCYSWLLTTIFS